MGLLKAGVARRAITPPVGIWMMGYANRVHGSTGVHDELTATAVVLDDGLARAVLVSCDLVFLHPAMVAQIRARVAERTGIPTERIVLCCSHTHSGPVTWRGASTSRDLARREAYLDYLAAQIADAAIAAARNLRPAAWGFGHGEVEIGMNRRQRRANGGIGLGANPGGTTDPELSVLRVDEVDVRGQVVGPLAALVNHACHAVCLSGNSYVLSADWPGVMRRRLEKESGAMVGFVQGACADINPLGGPQDDFCSAQKLGDRAAKAALAVYSHTSLSRDAVLRGARRVIDLPLLLDSDASFLDLASRVTRIPKTEVSAWLEERFPWSADLASGGRAARVEVQALRVGEGVLFGIAAEPFCEVGLEIKARSPAAHTLFAGYTNGSAGYLATPQAHEEGGYEVDSSYVYYRLPGPLAPECAALVTSTALDMIGALM